MIATLSGVVSEKISDVVIIEAGGVGYGIYVTAEDFSKLTEGKDVKVYTYEYIREQAHDLFGFTTKDNKALFERLLEVNGVGPKMALNMLSIGSSQDVRQAIAHGDVKFIQQANGVGKRLAERVVVELKDKVGLVGVDLESTGLLQGESSVAGDEAVEGLIALGYTSQDAAKALHGVDPELPTADRIKHALKGAS